MPEPTQPSEEQTSAAEERSTAAPERENVVAKPVHNGRHARVRQRLGRRR
jgi:hypothetical protein